ncbi:hypothetical protein B0H14DRAFT_3090216 [Mycena olivaceomarginata]|nr:hypothetical protein B0H14DRAFT_3090216 [Mycena olivaceomarginata]
MTYQQPMGMDVVDVATEPWTSKYGALMDLGYTGPLLSFSHLPYTRCLEDGSAHFDIGLIGARFGPFAIRSGSRRQGTDRGTLAWGTSPGELGAALLDCGDAINQMEAAYSTLLGRPVQGGTIAAYKPSTAAFALDGIEHPRLVTLGGDYTIERVTHGSFFAIAAEEGLLTNTSVHTSIRCTQRIGNNPVYLSLNIDVVDPGLAPASGWTIREVKRILRGLSGLNFVGADIIEVAPAYDNGFTSQPGWLDITGIAAADIVYKSLAMMQLESLMNIAQV